MGGLLFTSPFFSSANVGLPFYTVHLGNRLLAGQAHAHASPLAPGETHAQAAAWDTWVPPLMVLMEFTKLTSRNQRKRVEKPRDIETPIGKSEGGGEQKKRKNEHRHERVEDMWRTKTS